MGSCESHIVKHEKDKKKKLANVLRIVGILGLVISYSALIIKLTT